jgi:hypothetical protein
MQRRVERVEFERHSPWLYLYIGRRGIRKLAEVVGSTSTRSIFITLVNYGIVLNSVLTVVGQIQQQWRV